MSELKWIWLSEKCGVASPNVLPLVSRLGNIDAIYNADFDTYVSVGVDERTADMLCDKGLDGAYGIMSWCQTNAVGILCFDNEKFPASLRALPNPPCVLYYIGSLPDLNRELCISVVGTRRMSEYGMKAAYKISYEIAASGAITVSGMALGIDGVSACASIAAGGKTLAILGCGIDVVYPKEHLTLRNQILKNGAIITEYPPSTKPHGYNFPVRNRLISGMCVATLVVDAPEGSGALITAKNAILQGKDVYAVPGNIDGQNTMGTNGLIRDGATAVMCGRDIIKNYAYLYRHAIDMQKLTKSEQCSDFDPSPLLKMKVGMRIGTPAPTSIPRETVQPKASVSDEKNKPSDFESFKEKLIQKKQPAKRVAPEVKSNSAEKKAKTERPVDTKEVKGDSSVAVLDTLTPRQKEIFSDMPMDKPVTVDYFTNSGYTMGEVMSALTVLEIKGLVSSLPGALYIRK